MIPIALVTGFLGSGKTTFLQEISQRARGEQRLVFLINELSRWDVDGRRVQRAQGLEYSVLGGSIFCQCRVTEFIRILGILPGEAGRQLGGIDGLIVETSGISNPRDAAGLLRQTGLDKEYRIARIICLAAPDNLLRLKEVVPNIGEQIHAADTILLNKCDTVSTQVLDCVELEILRINPTAELHRTTYARIDLDPLELRPPRLGDDVCLATSNPFSALELEVSQALEQRDVEAALSRLGSALMRVKGCIPTRQGFYRVDYSDGNWSWTAEEGESNQTGRLVVIVPDDTEKEAEIFMHQLQPAK